MPKGPAEAVAWAEQTDTAWRVVLGEPLAGRTAVWEQVVHRAAEAGAAVFAGRAVAGDPKRPLATLQRLLAAWVERERTGPGLRATRGLGLLAGLVPELGGPPPVIDPTRLQAEVTALFRRLARQRPVLVAVDDLHLADAQTVALLEAAGAALPDAPLRVVATWCPGDAPDRSSPPAAATRVLGRVADDSLPPASGGLAGLAALLSASPDPVPDRLARRCADRLADLDPQEKQVLALLAVAGEPVEEEQLAEVAEVPGGAFDRVLDQLEARQWLRLVERGPVLWAEPSAPAWMAAVRAGLSRRRIRELHAAWLAVPLPGPREMRHTLGAGTAAGDGAVERLLAAGSDALAERRYGEAVELLDAALVLAERRRAPTAAILELLGNALRYADQLDAARDAWTRALEADPPPAALARLRRSLALLAWDSLDHEGALAHVRAGWQALSTHTGPEVEALLRTELLFHDRSLAMDQIEDAAARLEDVAVSAEARSEVWQARGSVTLYRGDEAGSLRAIERALAAAEEAREPFVTMRAQHAHHMCLIALGRPVEALGHLRRSGDATHYRFIATLLALLIAGRFSVLREHVEAEAPRSGVPLPLVRAFRAFLDLDLVRTRMQLMDLGVQRVAGHHRDQAMGAYFEALVCFERGDHGQVLVAIRSSGLVREDGIAGPLPNEMARMLGVALARTGEIDEARALAARLRERDPYAREIAALIEAEVARARGLVRAGGALASCAEAFEARHLSMLAARTRLSAVEAHLERSPDKARRLLDTAWTALVAEPAARDLARARELYAALGLKAPATPRRGATEGPLSARELDVVRLVARGLTNKEVAAALFVSPSTVATHLKRVYRRLDVHSRAALTRWAAEQGHLRDPLP